MKVADQTEFLAIAAQAHLDLAEVLDLAGSSDDAREHREAARELFERKGVAVKP